jgi:uncharacterized protein YbaR (Trm112 family)
MQTKSFLAELCCPICKLKLSGDGENNKLSCSNPGCNVSFPLVNGIPVLINEQRSVFSISDFTAQKSTTFKAEPKLIAFLRRIVPDNSVNLKATSNYKRLLELLLAQTSKPRVLVLGGSILGQGTANFFSHPALELVETDVSFGERTALICDAHDIPFEDASFDGVIIQAVLEHVVDPYRCVEEIQRVLKQEGLVYAETPFMQQVHLGRYDFTRFTHLGHRRLFRHFEELSSGLVCGPGMALAWSYEYFLLSFVKSTAARAFMRGFARLTGFWLKYFDYILVDKPGALDGAAGYYFLGKKSRQVLSDRELLKLYRGAM